MRIPLRPQLTKLPTLGCIVASATISEAGRLFRNEVLRFVIRLFSQLGTVHY